MATKSRKIVIGSRGSQLALWQANHVKKELEHRFPELEIEIEIIKTMGDAQLDAPLSRLGGKGVFTKEIEHALLERRIDLAVHSLKDLPTELPEGLTIGAITKREDVRDVFIAHPASHHEHMDDVPKNGTIATGSLRRRCQLLRLRPDLQIIDLRGNLNTRFAKLDNSRWDGMILARAGVMRLGFEDRITEILPVEKLLPAVGQGALAIEIRTEDASIQQYVRSLASEASTIAVLGERALLRTLQGGCQVPIGAFGRIENDTFVLDGLVGSLDGKKIVRGRVQGAVEQSEELGTQLAKTLFESGGKEILESLRSAEFAKIPDA